LPFAVSMDDTRVRIPTTVRASASGDGLILLDLSRGLVFAANLVGARIWELLEQDCARHEIVQRLAADYEVTVDRADADVEAFVATLVERGLLTRERPCP
jgi:Coenzyme PQQ synthesis protein D (PqqD)